MVSCPVQCVNISCSFGPVVRWFSDPPSTDDRVPCDVRHTGICHCAARFGDAAELCTSPPSECEPAVDITRSWQRH